MPTAGSILEQSFSTYFRNFGTYAAICAIVLAPPLLLQGYAVLGVGGGTGDLEDSLIGAEGSGLYLLATFLTMIFTYLAIAAMDIAPARKAGAKAAARRKATVHSKAKKRVATRKVAAKRASPRKAAKKKARRPGKPASAASARRRTRKPARKK